MKDPRIIYENVHPQLVQLEVERKKRLQQIRLLRIFTFLPMLLVVVWFNAQTFNVFYVFGGILIIGLVQIVFLSFKEKSEDKYYHLVQKELIPNILLDLHPNLEYDGDHHIPFKHFQDSYLFDFDCVEFGGRNYFNGNLYNCNFLFSEIEIYENRGGNTNMYGTGGGDEYYPESSVIGEARKKVVFNGLFFVIQTAHWHEGVTFVLEDKFEKHLGSVALFFQRLHKKRGEHIYFSNLPAFEKQFKVYGVAPEEAKKLLTKDLLMQLVDLQSRFDLPLNISFRSDKVYVIFEDKKQFFKFGLNKEGQTTEEIFNKTYTNLMGVFEVVHLISMHMNNQNRVQDQ